MADVCAHPTGKTVLVASLVVLFAAVIGWFWSEGVPLRVMAAIVPIVFTAYVMMGAMLWFVITGDDAHG